MSLSMILFFVFMFALICIFRVAKIGALVAFLIAGILAGPHGFGLFQLNDTWDLLGNLGVLFLWFMVGLEMDMSRIWTSRKTLLGFGVAQVLMVVFMAFPIFAGVTGWSVTGAMMAALMLALSSSSQDMTIMADRGQLNTVVGHQISSVLLFQDLLVVPLMVLLPVIAGKSFQIGATAVDVLVISILLIGAIIIVSRLVLTPLLKRIARLKSREAMLLTVLLSILICAYVMNLVGLPMGLGGFLAGLLMSETIYHHQISVDVNPYTMLFLAFFFIALGMGLDITLLANKWYFILLGVVMLVGIKFSAIFMVARIRRIPIADAAFIGLILSQGSEFALLFLHMMRESGVDIIPLLHQEILIAVIVLSMVTTPLVLWIFDILNRNGKFGNKNQMHIIQDSLHVEKPRVVICGFGRVGQIVSRMLDAKNIPYIAIDTNVNSVMSGREQGLNVVYGDVRNIETLRRFGLSSRNTRAVVMTLNNEHTAHKAILSIRAVAPRVKIFARARNLDDSKTMLRMGVTQSFPETIESSFWLGYSVLSQLGFSREEVRIMLHDMRKNNYEQLSNLPEHN